MTSEHPVRESATCSSPTGAAPMQDLDEQRARERQAISGSRPAVAAPRGTRPAMLTTSPGRHAAPRRHVLGPAILTALLAASAVAVAPQAAHALEPRTATASLASAMPAPTAPYRVLPGQRLVAKAPAYVLPVRGYHLTGRFGQVSGLWATVHTGLDFAAPEGTEIRSIAAGTVLSTAYDGAYGNKTVVRLSDGTVLWYCHQSSFGVHPGQRLKAGELLGYVGSTGNTTGPHLHLEVHPRGGDAIDPEAWLPTHGLHP